MSWPTYPSLNLNSLWNPNILTPSGDSPYSTLTPKGSIVFNFTPTIFPRNKDDEKTVAFTVESLDFLKFMPLNKAEVKGDIGIGIISFYDKESPLYLANIVLFRREYFDDLMFYELAVSRIIYQKKIKNIADFYYEIEITGYLTENAKLRYKLWQYLPFISHTDYIMTWQALGSFPNSFLLTLLIMPDTELKIRTLIFYLQDAILGRSDYYNHFRSVKNGLLPSYQNEGFALYIFAMLKGIYNQHCQIEADDQWKNRLDRDADTFKDVCCPLFQRIMAHIKVHDLGMMQTLPAKSETDPKMQLWLV